MPIPGPTSDSPLNSYIDGVRHAISRSRTSNSDQEPLITVQAFAKLSEVHHLVIEYLQDMVPAKMVRLSRKLHESTIPKMFEHIVLSKTGNRNPFQRNNFDYINKNIHHLQYTRTLHLRSKETTMLMLDLFDYVSLIDSLNVFRPQITEGGKERFESKVSAIFTNLQVLQLGPWILNRFDQDIFDQTEGTTSPEANLNARFCKFFEAQLNTQTVVFDMIEDVNSRLLDEMIEHLVTANHSKHHEGQPNKLNTTIRLLQYSHRDINIPKLNTPYTLIILPPTSDHTTRETISTLWLDFYWYGVALKGITIVVPNLQDFRKELELVVTEEDDDEDADEVPHIGDWYRDILADNVFINEAEWMKDLGSSDDSIGFGLFDNDIVVNNTDEDDADENQDDDRQNDAPQSPDESSENSISRYYSDDDDDYASDGYGQVYDETDRMEYIDSRKVNKASNRKNAKRGEDDW
ncbi:uncharacterized protein L201_001480 [Kwoniella dendrophila CBS 6074]|uniref:Uncharacterized protein n=1 Tax=Kwoniella dendrophila CBS 6074 TaxID=1295534 RepID=A0AAX4JP02_9TREE